MARRLSETHPETRVLYTSDYGDDAVARHGVLEPATEFVHKPFSPAELARRVRDVLEK